MLLLDLFLFFYTFAVEYQSIIARSIVIDRLSINYITTLKMRFNHTWVLLKKQNKPFTTQHRMLKEAKKVSQKILTSLCTECVTAFLSSDQPIPTFISQDSHSDSEEGAEHIQQGDGHPQSPVIFTLGALGAFLNSCNTQFELENTAQLLDKGIDLREKKVLTLIIKWPNLVHVDF